MPLSSFLDSKLYWAVPVLCLLTLLIQLRLPARQFSIGALAGFWVLYSAGAILLSQSFEVGSIDLSSIFVPAGFLGVFLAGFCTYAMRGDRPEEISIPFQIAPYFGSVGILLLAIGGFVRPEIGVALLSVGFVVGLSGFWMFAESGFRGSRIGFSGVIASLAGPASILQQSDLALLIIAVSFCSLPLFFLLRVSGRKVKKAVEYREFERRGKIDPLSVVDSGASSEEEVVRVKRTSAKRKGRARRKRRKVAVEKPQILPTEPIEEETPFFGEGVLATEPGRQGDVKIDPWTGAAIVESENEFEPEEEYSEEDSTLEKN
tara:strand:+ start:36052 stop:37005 length:954 start_codon:yes stop_codon:yes gene_type:complete